LDYKVELFIPQIHRAFLLASMFIGAGGFAFAFIANHPSSGLINLGSSNV
jgi:hypothetical protein